MEEAAALSRRYEKLERTQAKAPAPRKAGELKSKLPEKLFLVAAVTALAVGLTVSANLLSPELPAPLDNGIPSIFAREPENPYAELYYYEADKQQRYEAYQAAHEELAAEDVVWQVNAGLDHDFYTEVTTVSDVDALPLIVNKYHQLPEGYVPADLQKLPSGKPATKATCAAYKAMAADARKTGLSLYAASAYRSYDLQKRLYNGYLQREKGDTAKVDTYSARPGHSEHQTGRAIDLCGSFGSLNDFVNTPESPWINENCYKYGFIVRYQQDIVPLTGYKYEPWHITYVGTEVSQAMHDLQIRCLEEYVVKYIDHQPPDEV